MNYWLPGLLVVGVVLFAAGWLRLVVAGFQRHPLTGLLALVPVLNAVTLPSLWHRVKGWVMMGLAGLVMAIVAWVLGGANQLQQHVQSAGLQVDMVPPAPPAPLAQAPADHATQTLPLAVKPAPATLAQPAPAAVVPLELPGAGQTETAVKTFAKSAPEPAPVATEPAPPLPPVADLPANALYRMVFKDMAVAKLADSTGSYVRLTQKDGRKREGKVLSASEHELLLDERLSSGTVERSVRLDEVREAAVLARQPANE